MRVVKQFRVSVEKDEPPSVMDLAVIILTVTAREARADLARQGVRGVDATCSAAQMLAAWLSVLARRAPTSRRQAELIAHAVRAAGGRAKVERAA